MFHDLGLDERLLKDTAKLGWPKPTFIQEKAIPHVLAGKDVIAQARTGSGKTGSYLLPFLHRIITSKQREGVVAQPSIKLIVLAPSRELCNQVYSNIEILCGSCRELVSFIDISPVLPLPVQKAYVSVQPDIIIATPSRLLAHLKVSSFCVKKSLMGIVIDEADLIFSFGFANEMSSIVSYLPETYQAFITSATITQEMSELKQLYLRNPVHILEQYGNNDDMPSVLPPPEQLEHYKISCRDDVDKFVVLVSLLKLHLLRGRTLIFVNSVDRAYRLRIVFEQFGVSAAILNPQLPASVRINSLNQFNSGRLDRIIACDMHTATDYDPVNSRSGKSVSEFNVARGIDFDAVSNVVNFDFPSSVKQYVHRAGRTARGMKTGTALSLLQETRDAKVYENLLHTCGITVKNYQLRMDELDGFRYRVKDAVQATTKNAIKEARLKEIKRELLNSEKLKRHFAANPRDLAILQHDKSLHAVNSGQNLRSIPDYIVPKTIKHASGLRSVKNVEPSGAVLLPTKKREKLKAKRLKGRKSKRESDPLKDLRAY